MSDLFTTNTEPDYIVTRVAKAHDAGDGLIRVFWASKQGDIDRLEFTTTQSRAALVRLGRELLRIADIPVEHLEVLTDTEEDVYRRLAS
jgi:hypothetical protein